MEENKSLKDQVNNIKTKNELDISEEKSNCENLKKHYEKVLEDIKISNSQECLFLIINFYFLVFNGIGYKKDKNFICRHSWF